MAPKKRTLAETDATQPALKCASRKKGAGKENEPLSMENDENRESSNSGTEAKQQPPANLRMGVDLYTLDRDHSNAVTEYICLRNPEKGDREGEDEDEDDEEEEPEDNEEPEDDEEWEQKGDGPKFGDSPDQHPGYKWVVTRAANSLGNKYNIEADIRDQDMFGCHFYNDFTAYGLQEMVENMLQTMYNEWTWKHFDIHRFWVHVQAMAFFFYNHGTDWGISDDGEQVTTTLAFIGAAVLSTMDRLASAGLLTPNSEIKNIPLILSLYLKLADDQADAMDYGGELPIKIDHWEYWPDGIVAYAKHHNIELSDETGVKGTSELVEKFSNADYVKFPKNSDDRWGYKRIHGKFVKLYSRSPTGKVIGGDHHVITKMSKKERIRASYMPVKRGKGKDPLEEMGPPPGIWKF